MSKQLNCAIIGSGNIGTDLLYKILKSEYLIPKLVVGIDEQSKGLAIAEEKGLQTTAKGIEGFLQFEKDIDIVFEATSAKAHEANASILKEKNKFVLDLTPAAIGPFVVPSVNLTDELIAKEDNVNMVTCGGQATVPIVYAVSKVTDVNYAELVSTISSKSAGVGTRANIDEFTQTTSKAIKEIGGAKESKTIIILNPAEPPILMSNTVYIEIQENSLDVKKKIEKSIKNQIELIREYVPGYRLKSEIAFRDNVVIVQIEVEGEGDFLPVYAGNLDIITAAAVQTAELYARKKESGNE